MLLKEWATKQWATIRNEAKCFLGKDAKRRKRVAKRQLLKQQVIRSSLQRTHKKRSNMGDLDPKAVNKLQLAYDALLKHDAYIAEWIFNLFCCEAQYIDSEVETNIDANLWCVDKLCSAPPPEHEELLEKLLESQQRLTLIVAQCKSRWRRAQNNLYNHSMRYAQQKHQEDDTTIE